MTSINRVDQAVLLLRARLEAMGARNSEGHAQSAVASSAGSMDALAPLRALVGQGQLAESDVHKAVVRALLTASFGESLSASLEFHAIADQVTEMLERDEAGRELLIKALRELG